MERREAEEDAQAALTETLKEPRIQSVLEVIRSDEFKQSLAAMGGYDMSVTGERREC